MYVRLGMLFFFASIVPLLILDGQTFTNTLIAQGIALTSALIAFIGIRNQKVSIGERRACRWIVLGRVGLAVVLATRLPWEYRFQKSFNEQMAANRRR